MIEQFCTSSQNAPWHNFPVAKGGTMNLATAVIPSVQALIMAGGKGERLYPLTASRPKPAVPFGGVFRIVDFTLSNCLNSGLSRVSLLTQYKHEELQAYIQQSWNRLWTEMMRKPLVCLPPGEGSRYRGTADAVFQNIAALRQHGPEFVLILSGRSCLPHGLPGAFAVSRSHECGLDDRHRRAFADSGKTLRCCRGGQ